MTFESILYEKEGPILTITLNRPEAANALNLQMAEELFEASLLCSEDDEIGAVILTGAGKLFSGGGDLAYFAEEPNLKAALLKMTTYLHGAISRLVRMSAPVICAVNGTAGGGGFSLMLSCDLAIAAENAKFTMAYTAAGLTPDASSTYFLPRLVGQRRANELALTNRRLTATEALDWGIVNQVVPADELMPTTRALAKRLANGPTDAFGNATKLLRQSFDNSLETQMELEAQSIANISVSPNAREGVRAFLEKRTPEFK